MDFLQLDKEVRTFHVCLTFIEPNWREHILTVAQMMPHYEKVDYPLVQPEHESTKKTSDLTKRLAKLGLYHISRVDDVHEVSLNSASVPVLSKTPKNTVLALRSEHHL